MKKKLKKGHLTPSPQEVGRGGALIFPLHTIPMKLGSEEYYRVLKTIPHLFLAATQEQFSKHLSRLSVCLCVSVRL